MHISCQSPRGLITKTYRQNVEFFRNSKSKNWFTFVTKP